MLGCTKNILTFIYLEVGFGSTCSLSVKQEFSFVQEFLLVLLLLSLFFLIFGGFRNTSTLI
jgi:hypothetical protein